MEVFFMPRFTKRINSAACQAPPHRPMGLLFHTPGGGGGSPILPGPCYPKLPCLRPTQSLPDEPLRAAKPGIHRIHNLHQAMPSGLHRLPPYPLCCTPHACTGLHHIHRDLAPKACQAVNPQTHRISTLLACALQAHHAHAPKAH
jgi:hypothetical protein